MSKLLLTEKTDYVCTLIMNRPEKRNSINPEMAQEIRDTLNSLKEDPNVRVVVLRGMGEEAFCSGFDISRIEPGTMARGGENSLHYAEESIATFPFPVIAMIYGFCVGGGMGLALACDFRIGAENARLGITPAKLGLVYYPQGMMRCINTVGVAHTKEIFFTGRIFDVRRARELGLVDYVVPTEQLSEFTYNLAATIAENAPLSVSGMKLMINRLLNFQKMPKPDRDEVRAIIARAILSEDLKEGQRAFMEKRKPRWQGR